MGVRAEYNFGQNKSIQLHKKSFTGSVEEFDLQSCYIEKPRLGQKDSFLLRAQTFSFEFSIDNNTQKTLLDELENSNYDQFHIEYYVNGQLKFIGVPVPKLFKKGYNNFPYSVTIVSTDGLGLLQQKSFTDDNEVLYSGEMTLIEIVSKCLNKLPYFDFAPTQNFIRVSCDKRSTDHESINDVYSISRYGVNYFINRGDRNNYKQYKVDSCLEVLKAVLLMSHCEICQKDGTFLISSINDSKKQSGQFYNYNKFGIGNTGSVLQLSRVVPDNDLLYEAFETKKELFKDVILKHKNQNNLFPNFSANLNESESYLAATININVNGMVEPFLYLSGSNEIQPNYSDVSNMDLEMHLELTITDTSNNVWYFMRQFTSGGDFDGFAFENRGTTPSHPGIHKIPIVSSFFNANKKNAVYKSAALNPEESVVTQNQGMYDSTKIFIPVTGKLEVRIIIKKNFDSTDNLDSSIKLFTDMRLSLHPNNKYISEDRIFVAENQSDLSGAISEEIPYKNSFYPLEVWTGSEWVQSLKWGSVSHSGEYDLHQLIALEILKSRKQKTNVLDIAIDNDTDVFTNKIIDGIYYRVTYAKSDLVNDEMRVELTEIL